LLIVDDNSQDNSVEVIQSFLIQDSRIHLVKNKENLGAGYSRNLAITKARGRFIAFLDSDDLWEKDKLTKQVHFMIHNAYALTYTWYKKIDMNSNVIGSVHSTRNVRYKDLLKSNVIGCLTAMYDVKKIGKVYMPTIRKRQDMALWLSILENEKYAWCLEEELASYRMGSNSLSSNKLKILFAQWSFYRNYLKMNYIVTTYYFANYVVRALKKHHSRSGS